MLHYSLCNLAHLQGKGMVNCIIDSLHVLLMTYHSVEAMSCDIFSHTYYVHAEAVLEYPRT